MTSAHPGGTGRDSRAGLQEATSATAPWPGASTSMRCRQQPQPANSIDRRCCSSPARPLPEAQCLVFRCFQYSRYRPRARLAANWERVSSPNHRNFIANLPPPALPHTRTACHGMGSDASGSGIGQSHAPRGVGAFDPVLLHEIEENLEFHRHAAGAREIGAERAVRTQCARQQHA